MEMCLSNSGGVIEHGSMRVCVRKAVTNKGHATAAATKGLLCPHIPCFNCPPALI